MSSSAYMSTERATKDLLGIMIDAVQDYAIYMLAIDGTVISWNRGAEQNTGYPASEIIGKNYALLFSPEARTSGEPQKELDSARKAGRTRIEGWHIRKDGSRFWAVATVTAVRDAQGELICFAKVMHDLTERHGQELALQDAVEDAKKAMDTARIANEEKSEFLANMSHELRTPLNAILGFSEMMISEISGALGDKNLEYAGHVHSSGHHLLALINDLLDFAKLDANAMTLNLQIEDIRRIAQSAIDVMQPQAAKAGVHIRLEITGAVRLYCDDRRMMQIFLNLLSNAVKFTGRGGCVTVGAFNTRSAVSIVVEDTGIGMDAEDVPRALSRFGQIESVMTRKTQGTGLGLPLVKQLVELHGGSLALTSQKGVGTKVTLEFSKETDPPAAA